MANLLDTVNTALLNVPTAVWVTAVAVLLVASIVVLPLARRQARAAGARAAGHATNTDRRDRILFLAALIPGFGFLGAVLAGNQRGLVAFGRSELHWHHGWEYLVPATLDGVGLSFAFLAFRAVLRRRNPDRAVRVAWGAAVASAGIQFGHETGLADGSPLAGGYLALLSLLVMVMFHELLNQFVEGTAYIVRSNPAFGLRWLTWPSNTACAWVAWRNWPPAEGTPATIAGAVAHLNEVRATKRTVRLARPESPWWASIMPWLRVADLGALLAEQRSTHEAERAALVERITAEQISGADQLAAAHAEAERHRITAERAAEHLAAERTERAAVQARLDAAEQARTDLAEQVATLAAERSNHSEQGEPAERSAPSRTKPTRSAGAPNAPKLTDDEAVRMLLRAHRSADYEWTSREVHRITGAGFGRIPKLLAAVAEHHERSGAEQASGAPGSDDKENVS